MESTCSADYGRPSAPLTAGTLSGDIVEIAAWWWAEFANARDEDPEMYQISLLLIACILITSTFNVMMLSWHLMKFGRLYSALALLAG
mmetsp:Transcript_160028/g.282148  ORF Transcript_160028/g.282148 Transcript_160028/m.282148 type:complete len:88 (+) Transcript_160028:78-341(+)